MPSSPRRAIAPLAAALAAGAIALSIVAAPAGAATVSCGETITADTTLDNDLLNCPNNGVIIDADDVTLDLNGHTIDGNGTPDNSCDPFTEFCDFGVAFDGHDGITVKNGSVRQFEGGVGAFGTRGSRLLRLSTELNRFGNIGVAGAARVVVRGCSGDRSIDEEGNGLGLFNSRRIRVVNSSFRNNAHVGIKPIGTTDSVIKGNVMAGNGDEGLLMEGGAGFVIRRNRLAANGGGITLGPGNENLISRNRVTGGNDGIRVEKGHGNLVVRNVVRRTLRAGIRLGIEHPLFGGAHNVVRQNRVLHSRGDGFVVGGKDRYSRLTANLARAAEDDGFDVERDTTKLTANHALSNGDLGIEAVPGVRDGGGNVARHNGDPRQCTNIACS